MTGDCHVPFRGSPGVRFPRATRQPSAQPTQVRTLHLPLPAEIARELDFPGLAGCCSWPDEVLCVPTTSSTSCDQPIFVDHAIDVSVFSDAVQVEVDRFG